MRMWMVPTGYLCNQHLLGEHGELHKHLHNFAKKHSMTGRISPVVLIEPRSIKARHDALAAEMISRGMNHASPLEQPDISYLPYVEQIAQVNLIESIEALKCRCEECERRIHDALGR